MNRRTIVLAAVLLLLCVGGIAAFFILKSMGVAAPVAEIYVDGTLLRTVELDIDDEFIINTQNGYNRIIINDGSISVSDANCPDKTCVNIGAVSSGVVPIICLPHRLEIRVVSDTSEKIDATVG